MSEVVFNEKEILYLKTQRIGRVATVSSKSMPHVVPVSFELRNGRILFGGSGFEKSLKFRQLLHNKNIAFVVDSFRISPWRPVGIEIRRTSKVVEFENGEKGIEIVATKKVVWGL